MKPQTTAIDHLTASEIELIAQQVYGFIYKSQLYKKWDEISPELKKKYLDGVKSGVNIILHNRCLP